MDDLDPLRTDHADVDPAPLAPREARALRRRVLERVADAEDSHLTVPAAAGDWQPFLDGIRIKVLRDDDGTLSYLLQFAPGARLPAHRHRQDEECVVLDGTLRVGTRLELGPGGYHVARRGALHATVWTDTGATIFLRGAVPHPDDELS